MRGTPPERGADERGTASTEAIAPRSRPPGRSHTPAPDGCDHSERRSPPIPNRLAVTCAAGSSRRGRPTRPATSHGTEPSPCAAPSAPAGSRPGQDRRAGRRKGMAGNARSAATGIGHAVIRSRASSIAQVSIMPTMQGLACVVRLAERAALPGRRGPAKDDPPAARPARASGSPPRARR